MKYRSVALLVGALLWTGCSPNTPVRNATSAAVQHTVMSQQEHILDSLVQAEDVPEGRYAMWWASKGDASFIGSDCFIQLNRIYESAHGVETQLLARLLFAIDAIDTDIKRMTYPEPLNVFLRGPQDTPLILTISQEKGVRFHFHESTCPKEYRDKLLTLFADCVESLRSESMNADAEVDPEWDPSAKGWWELARDVAMTEDVQSFGVLVIE